MGTHVEQIKDRLTIEDVIGSYVKLEKAGSNLKARCPFHNERTASFFVTPVRQSFYCFGCGVKGDMFSFVQQFEGVDFMGALHTLATRAGVELTAGAFSKDRSERERLYSLLEDTAEYYVQTLKTPAGDSAREYLKERGLTALSVKNWRIGYTGIARNILIQYLTKKGYRLEEIGQAGLIKHEEEKTATPTDKFRSRIMFPIFDTTGRVVAFTGRIFPENPKAPKYLNSPETALYVKSKILFGLDKAKMNARKADELIVVEGQMDLLHAHQAGSENTVALSGTALTSEHVDLLRRFANRVVFVLDPDAAGSRATLRSAALAIARSLDVRVGILPTNDDPADFIRKAGSEKWRQIISNAVHVIDFALERSLTLPSSHERLFSVRSTVLPYLLSLESTMERSHYMKKIATALGVSENSVLADLEKTKALEGGEGVSPYLSKSAEIGPVLEARLVGVLFFLEASSAKGDQVLAQEVRSELMRIFAEGFGHLIGMHEGARNERILEAELLDGGEKSRRRHVFEMLYKLEGERLKFHYAALLTELSNAERSKDALKVKELLERCKIISAEVMRLADLSKKTIS